jgi:enoyl-CoA hydratase/carnithine racemase
LKIALNASVERNFEAARSIEIEAYGRCFDSEDRREGVRAFVEKRPPNFVGR